MEDRMAFSGEALEAWAKHVGFISIIIAFVAGAMAWAIKNIKVCSDWVGRTLKKMVKEVFEEDYKPTLITRQDCESKHYLTDTNLRAMRDTIDDMKGILCEIRHALYEFAKEGFYVGNKRDNAGPSQEVRGEKGRENILCDGECGKAGQG